MKKLSEILSDPAKVLLMDKPELGRHVLNCLQAEENPVRRDSIAKVLSEPYHQDFKHEIAHAVEEALGWLASQCLLGASPCDQDLVFITDRGRQHLSGQEHAWGPADVV